MTGKARMTRRKGMTTTTTRTTTLNNF